MGKLVVQERPGGPVRAATRTETCTHAWVARDAWSGGQRHYTCISCPATSVGDPKAKGWLSGSRRD